MVNREGPSPPDRRWGGGQAGEERGPDELTGRQLTGRGKPLIFPQEFEDNSPAFATVLLLSGLAGLSAAGSLAPGERAVSAKAPLATPE